MFRAGSLSFLCNFFHTSSSIFTLTFFITLFYLLAVFTIILYLLSNIKDFTSYNAFSNQTQFNFLSGLDLLWLAFSPIVLILFLTLSWSSSDLLIWFGHLVLTPFQIKMTYYVSWAFFITWFIYLLSFYYTSQEIYDYTIASYSFFMWVLLLFFSNNILTFIFFIEVLSTLIMLMLITSVFSSAYFFNNLNLTRHSYFNQTSPVSFLQTIMFFFWISLVSSLMLFVFLTLLFLKFYTLEWYLVEHVFFYVVSALDVKAVCSISLTWLAFLFCIFLKCGLVPFYFWKPLFFKGIPLHSLFFYIVFFYFFLFSFFTYFFTVYMHEIFYFNLFINFLLIVTGVVVLTFVICESFYLKAFLAMSSILNTLLIFLALTSYTTIDYYFLL